MEDYRRKAGSLCQPGNVDGDFRAAVRIADYGIWGH